MTAHDIAVSIIAAWGLCVALAVAASAIYTAMRGDQ